MKLKSKRSLKISNFTNSKLVKWFKNPRPKTTLANQLKSKRTEALEEREKLISHTAYKLWEEDGKPDNRSEYYWFEAIKKLNSKTTFGLLMSKLLRLGDAIEKPLEEGLDFLKSLAILEILGILGNITIVIAVISFIATEKQRRNTEVYQAWQVITAAYDQSGSGGRKEALEFLNSQPRKFPFIWQKWEKQSLAGLDASKAYFHRIVLQGADLRYANLSETDLRYAEFQKANLTEAILTKANLYHANLEEAGLRGADLRSADLRSADLRDTDLTEVDLRGANLYHADLKGADLTAADLTAADLRGADLTAADLTAADLRGAILSHTILMNPIEQYWKQIKSACFWEQVIYVGKWNPQEKFIEPIEPDNTKFIEDLRNDVSSDHENSQNCPFTNTQ